MTKDTLFQLSTGDFVRNTKTHQVVMVAVVAPGIPNILSVSQIDPLTDWELLKSRLTVTKEEQQRITDYHKKIEEATKNASKG